MERACQQLSSDLAACGAQLHYAGLPEVYGDTGMLTQLFQNLIGNGIKFQPEGRAPEVHIEVQAQGDQSRFCVRDNGIGIESAFLEQIFVMLKRLHTTEQYAGTGIGLTLCQKIVQLHGGRIWVESAPDEGASFYFTLPAAAPESIG